MINCSHVTRRFGRVRAVNNVSFTLEPATAMALWGSNGAGKTTLIRCILGIIRCKGRITIDGVGVRRRGPAARSLVGYVPQELAFHDDVRLGSAMVFFARLRHATNSDARAALDAVGLTGHERTRVRDLSGGMKQRLALAIALLTDPPLVVLDEPTSNLDAAGRGEVVETLRNLKERGKTLLFASHRPGEVIALADRVLVLEKGRVERDLTPAELWPSESAIQLVRLHLSMATDADAADILRQAGHAVHLNGHGLCVAVPRDRKAAPIHTLAQRNIEVRDIEIIRDDAHTENTP